jgi:hypothetical protein
MGARRKSDVCMSLADCISLLITILVVAQPRKFLMRIIIALVVETLFLTKKTRRNGVVFLQEPPILRPTTTNELVTLMLGILSLPPHQRALKMLRLNLQLVAGKMMSRALMLARELMAKSWSFSSGRMARRPNTRST